MKLSTKGKYGVYAMYYLAEHASEGPMTLRSMSNIGVPEVYLEQLLGTLRRAGLVSTVRGAQGGYQLAKSPDQITVGAIINATEGPIMISDCVGNGSCEREGQCASRHVWEDLTDVINSLLDSITLLDMINRQKKDSLPE